MRKIILNSRGMVVLAMIVVISLMTVIMLGVASLEVLTAAKASGRVNEAFRYLTVVEEFAQVLARARSQGLSGACPAGYSLVNVATAGTVNMCLKSASPTTTCLMHTDYNGVSEQFCLRSLAGKTTAGTLPSPASVVAETITGTASEPNSVGTATSNANYHLNEPWFPAVNNAAWPSTNVTELVAGTCDTTVKNLWYGCMYNTAPGVTYLVYTFCKPKFDGTATTTCTDFTQQKIAVY